eukprot:3215856-Rhodomonas_salina.1
MRRKGEAAHQLSAFPHFQVHHDSDHQKWKLTCARLAPVDFFPHERQAPSPHAPAHAARLSPAELALVPARRAPGSEGGGRREGGKEARRWREAKQEERRGKGTCGL